MNIPFLPIITITTSKPAEVDHKLFWLFGSLSFQVLLVSSTLYPLLLNTGSRCLTTKRCFTALWTQCFHIITEEIFCLEHTVHATGSLGMQQCALLDLNCWLCFLLIADVSNDLWKLMLKPPCLCVALFNPCPCLVNKSLRKLTMPSAQQQWDPPISGSQNGTPTPAAARVENSSSENNVHEEKQCSQKELWRLKVKLWTLDWYLSVQRGSQDNAKGFGRNKEYIGGGLEPYRACCVTEWLPWLPLAASNSLQLCFSQRHYQPDSTLRHRKKKQTPTVIHCQTTYVKISMTLAKWKARRKIGKCEMRGKNLWMWQNRINVCVAATLIWPNTHLASELKCASRCTKHIQFAQ